jgi:hypothetical protein
MMNTPTNAIRPPSTRRVRDDAAVLQRSGFNPARGRADTVTEMPAVPRCLADGRDGYRIFGGGRGVDARDCPGIFGCGRGARRGFDRAAPPET